TNGTAELTEMRRRLSPGKIVPSLGVVVIAEGECAAVDRIRPRLERHGLDSATGSSEFSIEVARCNADALDGVGRRDQHLKESSLFIVVYALNLDIIRKARLAVDLRLQAVLGVKELRMWARRPRATGHGKDQALEVPVESKRQFGDLLALNQPTGISAVGLQCRLLPRNGNLF